MQTFDTLVTKTKVDKAANKEMQSENGSVVGMLGVTEFGLISEVVWVVVSEVVREVVSEVVREVVREVAREWVHDWYRTG